MRYWQPKTNIPVDARVGIAIASYDQTACLTALLSSLQAQTYKNFVALVVHDGPTTPRADRAHLSTRSTAPPCVRNEVGVDLTFFRDANNDNDYSSPGHHQLDKRFFWRDTSKRLKKFGHPHRHGAWKSLAEDYGCNYLMSTNGDNLYSPVFLEDLLSALLRTGSDLAYCNCIHSHGKGRDKELWQPLSTRLQRGYIDLGCWLAKADGVLATPWVEHEFAGDFRYLHDLVSRPNYRTAKVDGYHLMHN